MKSVEALNLETLRLLRTGMLEGLSFEDMTSQPEKIFGKEISEASIRQLKTLTTSDLHNKVADLSPQAVDMLHHILLDGRYVDTWKKDLPQVSEALGFSLSPSVQDELNGFDIDGMINHDPRYLTNIGIISVAVAVVVGVAVSRNKLPSDPLVVDYSKIPKF